MNDLLQYIGRKVSMHDTFKIDLLSSFQEEQPIDDLQILKADQYCKKLYFISEGSARTFHYLDGKDITSWFYTPGSFMTSWHSFFLRRPSLEYIEVSKGAILFSLTFEKYQALHDEHRAFERFGRLLLEEQLAFMDLFYQGFLFLTAKEKYELLITHFPELIQYFNLGHIASFLGITQETLSRIRRK